jgi:hypothetical protein
MTDCREPCNLLGIYNQTGFIAALNCRVAAYLNQASGADGVKIAVFRKGRANLGIFQAAAHRQAVYLK